MSARGLPLSAHCPTCQSKEVGANPFDEKSAVCHDCGGFFELEEEQPKVSLQGAVSADFVVCPHCAELNQMDVYGDEEVCSGCGLDPAREDYRPEEIAHLWKAREEGDNYVGLYIREVLLKGKGRLGTRLGTFLRESCGPHCLYASQCPQTAGNLATCFNEEFDMSRKSKRRKRNKTAKRNRSLPAPKSAGWLRISRSGWYANKGYGIETIRTEQSSGGES